ncbi:hypothetical protein YYE_04960 [Plasmodium vinckei vinckei]|uniref:CIR protein PIR protein n=1 Tax=Plasmodium vinckei vinckei TaxID=54757 RepID=A0A081I933_PLAVN|nr:hypothetical protein YYE_04960 [Plasmodium vinckei vinckei]
MAQSSYNIKDVYKEIFRINDYFYEGEQGLLLVDDKDGSLHEYCHYGRISGNGKCNSYFEMASSGVIYLIKNLKEKYGLEYGKLAEYAFLWLSYKLNQKPKNNFTDLNKFYTSYIVNNKCYNEKINGDDKMTYKKIIDTNNDLMNIKEISKFNYPFGILLLLYHVINNNKLDCTKYPSYPKEFADKFEELNNDSNNIKDSQFSQILSTLSDDYNNLKNNYGNNKSCDFPPLPQLTPKSPVEISGINSGQMLKETSEVTSSSSSILNTVIPGLSLFQRQYIRIKLKKTKEENEN